MSIRRFPLHTLGLTLVVVALHWLAPDPAALYFNARHIFEGETWRIITGHLMHADTEHLAWNCLGLAVLGTLLETRSRKLLWVSLGAGIVSVSLLLMTPLAPLENYCGLSGALNTLLLVAIWMEWEATGSWLMIAVAAGSVAKVVIELSLGESVLTHISWPPYAWSHLAGLISGILLVWVRELNDRGCVDRPYRESELTSSPL